MTEGERIKELRGLLSSDGRKMTLERFGERLGVGKTAVSRIENGDRGLTDQMARAICREFDVREEWLRTGEGPVFIQKTRSEQIKSFFDDIEGLEDGFKRRFVQVLSELDEHEWELLEQAVRIFARALDEEEEDDEAAIRREVADYERQLRSEREVAEGSGASKGSEGA